MSEDVADGSPGDGSRDAESTLFAGSSQKLSELEQAIGHSEPLLFRPVGNTSMVFRMRLAGQVDAAFKPRTRSHPRGDLAEVAAYRIGRFLGMTNVVPAVPRELPLETLRSQLMNESEERWDALVSEMLPSGDQLRGVAIYWVPGMRELGIDDERGMQRWARWLSQDGAPPYRDKSKQLAEQISSMIAFDYLIANWDRFSGANAQGDAEGRNLLVRDHNVAFYSPLPEGQHRKLLGHLLRVQRFSLSLATRLKGLDAAQLEAALHQPGDPEGYEPLNQEQKADLLQRRDALLSYIAALIAQHGQDRVLLFP